MKVPRLVKRLSTDFAWVLGGNVLYSACQWSAVVALAKLGNPAAVGEYALGMAVAAPVIFFASFQLRALLASDVNREFTAKEYLVFRSASLSIALVLIAGLAAGTGNLHRGIAIVLIGFAITLDHVSDTYYGFMQRHGRMDWISRSLMLKGPLSLALFCVAMYWTRNVAWAVVGMIAGRLVVLVMWDSRLGLASAEAQDDTARLHWSFHKMWSLLRVAMPLGLISMLLSLNSNIPRYFLEAHGGTIALGIYAAIASLLTTGNLVVSAYGQSIFTPVVRACADFDAARYRNCAVLAGMFGAILGGGAVLTSVLYGREILTHLFRREYGDHADILVRLMIAGTVCFVANGLGFVITAARSLRPQIPLLAVTLLTTAVVSAWAVPRYGLAGAADATLAGALVQLAGTTVILLGVYRRLQIAAANSSAGTKIALHESVRIGA
jgi:O-antigen/teichoic acid export membrane protein